jgi:transcriptional regulator with XRE-family HTH domain
MTQGERVRIVRKDLSLTLENFGKKLGVGKTAIYKIEKGENSLTDRMLESICREFNVNENWLRSGEGEMFLPVEDEVGEVVSKLVDELNPFYDMIIDIMHTFNNLDDKGQEIICNFTSDLVDRMAKRNKQDN